MMSYPAEMYSREIRSASATATDSEWETWRSKALASSWMVTYPRALKSASWMDPGMIMASFFLAAAASAAGGDTAGPAPRRARTASSQPRVATFPYRFIGPSFSLGRLSARLTIVGHGERPGRLGAPVDLHQHHHGEDVGEHQQELGRDQLRPHRHLELERLHVGEEEAPQEGHVGHPAAEDHQHQGDPAAAGRHVIGEGAGEDQGKGGPRE